MQEIDYLEQNNNMQIVLKTGSLEITCFLLYLKMKIVDIYADVAILNGEVGERMNKVKISVFICLFIVLSSCGSNSENAQRELHIFAAISLSEALEEMKDLFESEFDVTLSFYFGGSGKLAQQIEQGAPGDVFISANEEWMDMLIEKNLVEKDSYTPIVGNRLVFISRKDVTLEKDNLHVLSSPAIKQIAIGHPDTVPAGYYAKIALENSNLWDFVEGKMIYTQDVRQVATYVETGNAEVGFTYESDLIHTENVEVLSYVDESLYGPIIYPGAIRTDANEVELAEQFLQFLTTERAQEVFQKHGFSRLTNGD